MTSKLRVRDAATGRVIDVDEDEWLEFCRRKGILRDGQSVRVPIMAMDAAGRERPNWMVDDEVVAHEDVAYVADDGTLVTHDDLREYAALAGRPGEGYGLPPRPGARDERPDFVADAERETLDAYAEHDRALTNAWRRPPPAVADREPWQANAVFRPNVSARAEVRRPSVSTEPLPPVVTPHVELPAIGHASLAELADELERVRDKAAAAHRALLENAWRT